MAWPNYTRFTDTRKYSLKFTQKFVRPGSGTEATTNTKTIGSLNFPNIDASSEQQSSEVSFTPEEIQTAHFEVANTIANALEPALTLLGYTNPTITYQVDNPLSTAA